VLGYPLKSIPAHEGSRSAEIKYCGDVNASSRGSQTPERGWINGDQQAFMTRQASSWFRLEDRREHRFKDERVVSCYLGKVFQFHKGRNVWGPRTGFLGGRLPKGQNTYPGFESWSADLLTTKGKIQELRERGSRWTIFELPVVVIAGTKCSLIVGEINSPKPFSEFLRLKKGLLGLEDYGDHFEPCRTDSVVRIVCRAGSVCPATLPFFWHHSASNGGYCGLDYTQEPAEQDIEATLRVIHRINWRLQHEVP